MQFSDIINQHAVKEKLIRSVHENRVAHAQLFFGPEGSGNLALAIAYAQFLSCESRMENDSCGNCTSCKKYNKLIHPDFHFSYPTAPLKDRKARSAEYIKEWREAILENPYLSLQDWYEFIGVENKQGFISVEESAEIVRRLTLKSFESKYKIMIIWMPEVMRTEASNKLLKIIEEPPDSTIFLLVTENREQIIGTILSRTQLVKINRIADKELQFALKEKFNLEFHEAQRIVHLADGNYNVAQAMAKQESVSVEIEKEFIDWMRMCLFLSIPSRQEEAFRNLNEWMDVMVKAGRERQKNFISYGLEIGHECLVTNYADASLVRMTDEIIPTFSKFVKYINQNNADFFTEELNKAAFHIMRNANPRILFLDLSFKMNRILHLKENG
jgi:DNA polymerase-3 subunit delta'